MDASDPLPAVAENSFIDRRGSPSMLAVGLAGTVLFVSIAVIGWLIVANRDAADRTARQTAMIAASQRLVAMVTTAQSSGRGYVVTGDPAFLDPYRRAAGNLEGTLGELRLTYREADRSSDDIAVFTRPARQEMAFNGKIIAARDANGLAAAAEMVGNGESERQMDELQRAAASEIDRAQAVIRDYVVAVNNNNWTQLLASFAALASGAALCVVAHRRQRREIDMLRLVEGLIDHVPVGIGLLDADLTILRHNALFAGMVEDGGKLPIWSPASTLTGDLASLLRQVANEGLPIVDLDVDVCKRETAVDQKTGRPGDITAANAGNEGPRAAPPVRSLRVSAFAIHSDGDGAHEGSNAASAIALIVIDRSRAIGERSREGPDGEAESLTE